MSELLKKDMIERIAPDGKQAGELLLKAGNDLKVAKDTFNAGNYGWTLAIAYNSMLSAGRALMAKTGYRARSEAHHLAVVRFCAVMMPADASGVIGIFNKYRVRRHGVVYGESESVGEEEAKRALENAAGFLDKINGKIKR